MNTSFFYKKEKFKLLLITLAIISFSHVDAQCTQPFLHDDYSNPSLWTPVITTLGSVTFSGGSLHYNAIHGATYERVYRSLPATLPDTYFNASCNFMPMYGNGPAHYVMAFTAGTLDPISYDAASSYSLTNQDAIMVYYLYQGGTPSAACCSDPHYGPWQVVARSKKGNVFAAPSTGISILTLNQYSYVRLERVSPGEVLLHVYSDSTMTSDLAGSPVSYCIDPTITGLNTVQQGVITWSGYYRVLTAQIDDLNICIGSPSDTTIVKACNGTNALLQAQHISSATYIWSPSVACTTCSEANVPVTSSSAANYEVHINTGGCSWINQYFSIQKDSSCPALCSEPQIPNVFTPNNDKINDEFIINSCNGGNLKIYNRWGELVFVTTDLNNFWNGKLMNTGSEVPDGTYYYIVNRSNKISTGYIAVIR